MLHQLLVVLASRRSQLADRNVVRFVELDVRHDVDPQAHRMIFREPPRNGARSTARRGRLVGLATSESFFDCIHSDSLGYFSRKWETYSPVLAYSHRKGGTQLDPLPRQLKNRLL